jgi:Apolipoprotein N-acyltransferase
MIHGFGRSIGPDQHLEIAQNRALEHKKPLLRSTNSGISAIVSKDGQVIEKQGYFEEKNIKNNIVLYSGNTIYSSYGNFPIIILIVFYMGFLSIKSLLRIK